MEKSKVKNIIVIAACLILGVVFVVASYMVLNLKIKDKTNVEEYAQALIELKDNSDAHSGLFIFPESVNVSNVKEYKYLMRDDLFNGSYLFYLVVNYTDEDYNAEVERLKNIKAEYPNSVKNPLYNKIELPTYITIFDGNGSYEYVMLDNENKTIAYIFNQLFNWDEIEINDEYLLKNYSVNSNDKDVNQNGYNMYYFYDKNGIGTGYNEI